MQFVFRVLISFVFYISALQAETASSIQFQQNSRSSIERVLLDQNKKLRESSNEYYFKQQAEKRKIQSDCNHENQRLRLRISELEQQLKKQKNKYRSSSDNSKGIIIIHEPK